jgi:O-antigen/teichoic acid export membrane protein
MNFKKDIVKVLSSNIVNLFISIITMFLIPAFLSLDQYAYLKTFTLYIGFIGILHFGFVDGIYIKYGGKKEEEIDKGLLKSEHNFLLFIQLCITIIFFTLGIIIKDKILIAFSLAIIPVNMQTLYKFLYQALGEFGKYSKITLITPNLLLVLNIIIIFIIKVNNYWPFIIGTLLTYYIVFIWLEINFFLKSKGFKSVKRKKELITNFKVGIFIMVGNLAGLFIYSLDRWFIKFFFTTDDFAIYSFAISMMTAINILVSSLTMTIYPYLVRNQEENFLKLIKGSLLMVGTLASGGYFIFSFIVTLFMEKYIPSLNIISILFAGFPAIIIINALLVNLYKAQKREKLYFSTVLKMLAVTVIINLLSIIIYREPQTIAWATTISFYGWFIFSTKHFISLKINYKEVVYILFYLSIFFTTVRYFSWWQGVIVYLIAICVINIIFYNKEIENILSKTLNRVPHRLVKR